MCISLLTLQNKTWNQRSQYKKLMHSKCEMKIIETNSTVHNQQISNLNSITQLNLNINGDDEADFCYSIACVLGDLADQH